MVGDENPPETRALNSLPRFETQEIVEDFQQAANSSVSRIHRAALWLSLNRASVVGRVIPFLKVRFGFLAGGFVDMSSGVSWGGCLVAASAEMMTASAEVMAGNAELYPDFNKATANGEFTPADLWRMRPKAEGARRAADRAGIAACHLVLAIDRSLARSLKSVPVRA